jgi:hypothetical protein
VIERIKSQAERVNRAKASIKTASRIERINYLSSATNSRTLRDYDNIQSEMMSLPAAPAQEQAQRRIYTSASETHQFRSKKLMSILQSKPTAQPLPLPPPPDYARMDRLTAPAQVSAVAEVNESIDMLAFDDVEEAELQAIESELGAAAPIATTTGFAAMNADLNMAQQSVASDIDGLLRQLVKEPSDDAELAAKFLLFENFLETVTTIRQTTLAFWEENMDQFEGSSRLAQQKLINEIDGADKLGIPDDASKWFVYYMTRQANNNSKAISNVLSGIKGKLNILSQELGECPFCLDQLHADNITTLSCCHRTCKPCWDHWSELKGNSAFCPLCNHQEFIGEIASL